MPDGTTFDTRQRLIDAAHRYSAADRSDPFALRRALAHIRAGICDPYVDEHGQRREMHYDATESSETRTLAPGYVFSDGSTEYRVTVFKTVVRP